MRGWPRPLFRSFHDFSCTYHIKLAYSVAGRHQGWPSQDNCILFTDGGLTTAALTSSWEQGTRAWGSSYSNGSQDKTPICFWALSMLRSCWQSLTWLPLNRADVQESSDPLWLQLVPNLLYDKTLLIFGGWPLNLHISHTGVYHYQTFHTALNENFSRHCLPKSPLNIHHHIIPDTEQTVMNNGGHFISENIRKRWKSWKRRFSDPWDHDIWPQPPFPRDDCNVCSADFSGLSEAMWG